MADPSELADHVVHAQARVALRRCRRRYRTGRLAPMVIAASVDMAYVEDFGAIYDPAARSWLQGAWWVVPGVLTS